MLVSTFDFELPAERIALRPVAPRDLARMLVVHQDGRLEHATVANLPQYLGAGDILAVNDTRVFHARLHGHRPARPGSLGGPVEIEAMLHKRLAPNRFLAFVRPAKRLRPGDVVRFGEQFDAQIVERGDGGQVELAFALEGQALDDAINRDGQIPLPPYIANKRSPEKRDEEDYQTYFARKSGSVAAPTAGLHFTPRLLGALDAAGVTQTTLTLHVGAGTFLPVSVENTDNHHMHSEWAQIDSEATSRLNAARAAGGRIMAVGTTSLRTLETATRDDGRIDPFCGETDIFITPGYRFKTADMLLTNFHLPRSTLFMLVCAFSGTEIMRAAYAEAIREKYRFYSYGRRLLAYAAAAMSEFSFEIFAADGGARTGAIRTPRGEILTPAFMPVGTAATVKAMLPQSVRETGADIVLGNTYHLMLRPGAERIATLGGLHKFMNWERPILTDSGGFQVMSLSKIRKISEDGVSFNSHIDGSAHFLSPERAMEIQNLLGSDIQMVLDECPAFPATEDQIEKSLALSMRWAKRSKAAFVAKPGRACFGIVQGGVFPHLRTRSAQELQQIGFDGYAVGGLAVGEGRLAMFETLEATVPHLPRDRPRYLMGVGKPADLVGAVLRGIDMFDCVLPTRSGRNGQAFTRTGSMNLRNARYAEDASPLDSNCLCPACRGFTRAYLHHVVKANEIIASMLLTWHNLTYYQDLMAQMRAAISTGTLNQCVREMEGAWQDGDK